MLVIRIYYSPILDLYSYLLPNKNPFSPRDVNRFYKAFGIELFPYILSVSIHCVSADEELFSYLFARKALRGKCEYFLLPWSKRKSVLFFYFYRDNLARYTVFHLHPHWQILRLVGRNFNNA